jgi:hypothetical protein
VNVSRWGNGQQGFRRMAAKNKPAGIRVLVYGIGKGKAVIEGLSVSTLNQAEHYRFWPLSCGPIGKCLLI